MLTPAFSDAGISVFNLPHSSCSGLSYQVTVRSGGVVEDVQLKEGVIDHTRPIGSLSAGGAPRYSWNETGHGKQFEAPIQCGSSTSGLLKLTDYGGSVEGMVDFESVRQPTHSLPGSLDQLPGRVQRELSDMAGRSTHIPHASSDTSRRIPSKHCETETSKDLTFRRPSLHLSSPDLATPAGTFTMRAPTFRLQKPRLWLEMEQRAQAENE